MQLKWRLSHVQGYLELGLIEEAAAEWELIPTEAQATAEVLALRLAILQEQKRWPELREIAAEFVRQRPAISAGWVTWAYAVRRTDSLGTAEQILLRAEEFHPQDATIQFNLGCYACQRGDLVEARRRVDRAIALDKDFEAAAATDVDLAPLRATPLN